MDNWSNISLNNDRKPRVALTMAQKLEVIERYESGHRITKIFRDLGIPESTVRNIIRHADQIKQKGEVTSAYGDLQTSTRNRSAAMVEMEGLLAVWVQDCNQRGQTLRRQDVQKKARDLFQLVKENRKELDCAETFSASGGWYSRFRNRIYKHNDRITHIEMPSENVFGLYIGDVLTI